MTRAIPWRGWFCLMGGGLVVIVREKGAAVWNVATRFQSIDKPVKHHYLYNKASVGKNQNRGMNHVLDF
jgi:hypothetical protein